MGTMDACLFCKIIQGEIPSAGVYEDDSSFAFLDIKPVNPGHTLLIPKEHYANLYELPDELLVTMAPVVKKLAVAIKKAANADGINIGMNNDPAAGQIIFHVHFQIIPRFSGDGHKAWTQGSYKEGERQAMAERVMSAL